LHNAVLFNKGIKKQPFSYYGGKQRMVSKILPYIPKHTVYIEPFCGGASVFWHKAWPSVNNTDYYREVLNDFDGRLVNFFRVLQDKDGFEKLQHKLQFTPYSEEEYRTAKNILKNLTDFDDITRAWAWFVQANMSFSGKIFAGWGRVVFKHNTSATWANKLDLQAFFNRLVSTSIANVDAITCLRQFNCPQAFAYIDPPYMGTDCKAYVGDFTVEKYKEFLEFLDKEFVGSFILSGYNNDFVGAYGWERVEFTSINSAKGTTRRKRDTSNKNVRENTARTEVLWMRGNTKPVREELQKLYDSGKFDCFTGNLKEAPITFTL